MRRTLLAVPAFAGALLFACSSSDSATTGNGGSGDDGGGASADGSSASSHDGSVSAEDGAIAVDGSSAGDAASEKDSGTLPSSKPPAGTSLCKQGTLTPEDVTKACNQPVSFGPAPVNECDAVTSTGGKYEVWCGAAQTYVWAEITDLAPKKNECPVGNGDFSLHPNANYTFSAGAVGAGGATLTATGGYPYLLGASRSFVLEATFGATAPHGSFTIWASGIDTTCLIDGGFSDALVAGASGAW